MLVWKIPQLRQPRIWLIGFGILALVIVGLVGIELSGYWQDQASISKLARITVYQLVTMTEIPLIQLASGFLLNWILCRFWT